MGKAVRTRLQMIVAFMAILVVVYSGGVARVFASNPGAKRYLAIQVVDRQTGRGVPLVELRTTNNIRYVTCRGGIVAFHEPGLMDRDVFFFVESHGYEFPKDGFGMAGKALRATPGTEARLEIDRLNVAERLYRVTGQGIYRDSVLTGRPVPLRNSVLNGQVMGQDSVFTCLYRNRLFWMWGDTGRPGYPLGNFEMSGAVSDLPGRGGLDPAVGVDLEYFVDEKGFSRPMSPLKEPGLVWLDGLLTVEDRDGRERMVAKFARLKGLGDVRERGLVVYNDDKQLFEPLVRGGLGFLPYANTGHAFPVSVGGQKYYYFTSPSPMGVRLRVRGRWDDVVDPNRYEVWTTLESEGPCRWVRFADLIGADASAKSAVIKALEEEGKGVHVYDVESGEKILPHNGTVYFNAHRRRWVGLFVQNFGRNSMLGEVWYAEADTPVGPWAYARKVVTHNKYSFYNPKHHPLFDREGGRVVFFEGTYSFTFSGSLEASTPRYDYNQIMYRLDLDDPRMVLPVAVYRMSEDRGYALRDGVERADGWDAVESVPFYAVEPDRAGEDMIAVYAQQSRAGGSRTTRLTAQRPAASADPLFYGLPPAEAGENPCVADLYEYRHSGSGQYRYEAKAELGEAGWERVGKPLCRVWKAPAAAPALDADAGPVEGD
ncbi:MAG: hypothetical protein JW741_31380 [Sedimentisphaerales bacterium]|nr:hypothetical protein [Sedimentisphaerales bacterium]